MTNIACAEVPHFALHQNASIANRLSSMGFMAADANAGPMAMNITLEECARTCAQAAVGTPFSVSPSYFAYGVGSDGSTCCTCPGHNCTAIHVSNSTVYVFSSRLGTGAPTTQVSKASASCCYFIFIVCPFL